MTWTRPLLRRTCLSWTSSSSCGCPVPSILRRWLLSGRHSPWACFEVEEGGPRSPGAVGPEGILLAATPIHHAKRSACMHGFGVPFSCGFLTLTTCVSSPICKGYVRRRLPKWLMPFWLKTDCGPWVLQNFTRPPKPMVANVALAKPPVAIPDAYSHESPLLGGDAVCEEADPLLRASCHRQGRLYHSGGYRRPLG